MKDLKKGVHSVVPVFLSFRFKKIVSEVEKSDSVRFGEKKLPVCFHFWKFVVGGQLKIMIGGWRADV